MISKYHQKQLIASCSRGHDGCSTDEGGRCERWPTDESYLNHLGNRFIKMLEEDFLEWPEDASDTDAEAYINGIHQNEPSVDWKELWEALMGRFIDWQDERETSADED